MTKPIQDPVIIACSLAAAALMSGCGGGAHDAMRPDQPTAAKATGRVSIPAVDGPSSPLVVDWKAEQRADLEEAIHDGIAVVAWDDKGLRLLKGCHVTGNYGYLPVQVKKDVVRLETADDVQANLPLGGIGLVGKIGGGFSSGTTLDIALAMVGKRRTTWNAVARDDLEGNCDGATHYVRAILVGAFAMKTGSRAKAEAAVEIFGAGTSGQSSSSKDVDTSDGKLEACEKASGDEEKPPSNCGALLRLELEPIAKEGSHATAAPAKPEKESQEVKSVAVEGCPPGFVFSAGACKKGGADRPHACSPMDANECDAQCKKGDAASCDRLGTLIATGKKGPPDAAAALAAFKKSCDGDYGNGCANLGVRLLFGPNHDAAQAATALDKGCMNGSARACEIMGEVFLFGQGGQAKDAVKSLKYFAKGCDGGDFVACTNAGFLYAGGGGAAVSRDDQKALRYAQRACFGGVATACGNAGYKIELGESVNANPKLALALYERACRLDKPECFRAGLLYMTGGKGVTKDDAKAKALLGTACKSGGGLDAVACVVEAKVFGGSDKGNPGGLAHTTKVMAPQCDQKDGRACTFLGIAEYGQGKKADAAKHLGAACGFKDPLGCELKQKLK
jgi:uncharacterized protein